MPKQLIERFVWEDPVLQKVTYQLTCGHLATFDTSDTDHATEMCELINTYGSVNCFLCESGLLFVDPADLKPGEKVVLHLSGAQSFVCHFCGVDKWGRFRFQGMSGLTTTWKRSEIRRVEVVR